MSDPQSERHAIELILAHRGGRTSRTRSKTQYRVQWAERRKNGNAWITWVDEEDIGEAELVAYWARVETEALHARLLEQVAAGRIRQEQLEAHLMLVLPPGLGLPEPPNWEAVRRVIRGDALYQAPGGHGGHGGCEDNGGDGHGTVGGDDGDDDEDGEEGDDGDDGDEGAAAEGGPAGFAMLAT